MDGRYDQFLGPIVCLKTWRTEREKRVNEARRCVAHDVLLYVIILCCTYSKVNAQLSANWSRVRDCADLPHPRAER